MPSPARLLAAALAAALSLPAAAVPARGLLDPHIPPEPCESCHTRTPTPDEARAGEYLLLRETIDATCQVCHEKTCCRPGALHAMNHPSGVDTWDKSRFRRPATLPLYRGFITCSTCHLHSKPEGESYRMLRLVRRDGRRIDWSALCLDCHAEY